MALYICAMLSEQEKVFIEYWKANRELEKSSPKPLIKGFIGGLAIGVCVMFTITSGWYQRATMVANSRLSGFTLLLAILLISGFISWIYRNYRWERMEQQYKELIYKQQKENSRV
jgi:formate/nitrite transporter FocA (FNT family)